MGLQLLLWQNAVRTAVCVSVALLAAGDESPLIACSTQLKFCHVGFLSQQAIESFLYMMRRYRVHTFLLSVSWLRKDRRSSLSGPEALSRLPARSLAILS